MTNLRTLELAAPRPTFDRIDESKSCEMCDRNQEGICLASGPQRLEWEVMSKRLPVFGGCGPDKLKYWRAK